ncbi:MAG: M14 family zinc carboxypeptidase [Bacteroidota bacterium]
MKRYVLTIICLLVTSLLFGQFPYDLSYYLGEFEVENKDIPSPKEVLRHEVGEWHVSHDKLVQYMHVLADASDRVKLISMGGSHENREQVLLVITSAENHERLEELRLEHIKLADAEVSDDLDTEKMPIVIWQGFSIHGNEPSGGNAALALAYYYAVAGGDEFKEKLNNAIILLDPVFNPDGFTRFASWANAARSKNLVTDPSNREQNEVWPGGRTNHYWFDLNRDWLPLQQPESRNRIVQFHRWKPNILTDHHEMGTNRTFFFQPGIPSRNNPNTPAKNFELTSRIGTYHAKALDEIGSMYYSKESYDDFYYGKGSTFPDIHGAIGILFEQASSRGHAQDSENGVLTFPFTIRNQTRTGLSTFEAGLGLRKELLDYQREFYKNAIEEGRDADSKGILIGNEWDRDRTLALMDIMTRHGIMVKGLSEDIDINGQKFPARSSFIIPFDQSQYRLVKIMTETSTSFQDSLFYDVSSWTLPMAFNMNTAAVDAGMMKEASDTTPIDKVYEAPELARSDYGYALDWGEYYAPSALQWLHDQGILTKVSTTSFLAEGKVFYPGTILVMVQHQREMESNDVYKLLKGLQAKTKQRVYALPTGNTEGVNLGSPKIATVKPARVAMLVEGGVRSYDAGEVWHLLDNRYGVRLSQIPFRLFPRVDLSKYETLIMVDGSYSTLSKSSIDKLKRWIRNGGNIIACKRANDWLLSQGIIKLSLDKFEADTLGREDYEDLTNITGAQVTGGAIFMGDLDNTHPLGFGYANRDVPIFVNTNTYFKQPPNPYAFPLKFSEEPLLSGYISEENLGRMSDKAAIVVSRYGSGRIMSFSFNPNFRAFWYGTNRMFINALFFGDLISSSATLGE